MISDKRKLQVANVCYANISSSFAIFCNPKYRGANFKWSHFEDIMVNECDSWLLIHLPKVTPEMRELAKGYTKEIVDNILNQSGFLETENENFIF